MELKDYSVKRKIKILHLTYSYCASFIEAQFVLYPSQFSNLICNTKTRKQTLSILGTSLIQLNSSIH